MLKGAFNLRGYYLYKNNRDQKEGQMLETIGTLNLKIAQLEHYLQLLKKREMLSRVYPEHQKNIAQQAFQVQLELDQLRQCRDILLQEAINPTPGGTFNGITERRKPLYAIN